MFKRMYCLFDSKANAHLNPVSFVNDGEAVRWFTTIINAKEETNVSRYPKDFSLCYLGTFDDESGEFKNEYEELIHGPTLKEPEDTYTIKELIKTVINTQGN